MAHTLSPRARSSRIRATRLSQMVDCVLAVDCSGSCGRRRIMVRDLGAPDQTLGEALRRMRCRVCGGRVVKAALLPLGRGEEVPVWGGRRGRGRS